jgi:hypothetical protein
MSLNRKNQPEQQKVGYISREVLKKEAERIRRQSKTVYTSQQAQEIPKEEQPQDEMERISAMVRQLAQQSGVNSQEAQKDERVTLLAAATLEMCRILERFSKTISEEMKKTIEIELQNLDIQKQYAENVRISTVSVVRDIYYQFEGEQKKAFDKVTKYLSDTNDRLFPSMSIDSFVLIA